MKLELNDVDAGLVAWALARAAEHCASMRDRPEADQRIDWIGLRGDMSRLERLFT